MGRFTGKLSKVAEGILQQARIKRMSRGDRLTEAEITESLGISRTPVRRALKELCENGFAYAEQNRGCFLNMDASEITVENPPTEDTDTPEGLYRNIARDRIKRQLEDTVTENELMRRYNISRGQLKRVLTQIAEEGWIEQKAFHGWRFLPMVDSKESLRENYELRILLEPQVVMLPSFEPDREAFKRMLEIQRHIAENGSGDFTDMDLVSLGAEMHELPAASCHNRFILQTVRRVNMQRRAMELLQSVDRKRVEGQCAEHVRLIEIILSGWYVEASEFLREHLKRSLREKINAEVILDISTSGE
ncbi:GntR family transcriptional regulator [Limisalsivibrio acetivorans]|uniref:GntR family transcriptional regulator n=1 Tax=Limisalsivibrio acetivorans TaxID=1304888 RepID=UPI0003B5BB1A|nr:GntR family transcriptional regulator [Limisalsivibrio acetivorans]